MIDLGDARNVIADRGDKAMMRAPAVAPRSGLERRLLRSA
jgi:hypothetical protein